MPRGLGEKGKAGLNVLDLGKYLALFGLLLYPLFFLFRDLGDLESEDH